MLNMGLQIHLDCIGHIIYVFRIQDWTSQKFAKLLKRNFENARFFTFSDLFVIIYLQLIPGSTILPTVCSWIASVAKKKDISNNNFGYSIKTRCVSKTE